MKRSISNMILILITVLSCTSEDKENPKPDVVKFKSGAFGSKMANFMIDFPAKPVVITERVQIGKVGWNTYAFQQNIGIEKEYTVMYASPPKEFLQSWDTEQLLDQSAKGFASRSKNLKLRKRVINEDDRFEKSITYEFYDPKMDGLAVIKAIRKDNSLYHIIFYAFRNSPEIEVAETFIDSFEFYPITSKSE